MSEQIKMADEIDRLTAENEALREEVEQLRDQFEQYKASMNDGWFEIEQERDQLKAAVALAIDTFEQYQMDVDTYPPIKHVALMQNLNGVLADHNAEVIKRLLDHLERRATEEGYFTIDPGWLGEYANQLRQQAKETQS